jgi:hypothetical protein
MGSDAVPTKRGSPPTVSGATKPIRTPMNKATALDARVIVSGTLRGSLRLNVSGHTDAPGAKESG